MPRDVENDPQLSPGHRLWLVAVVLIVTWGAAAFGSTYAWAYRPLLVASGLAGLAGILLGSRRNAGAFLVGAGLALTGVAIAMQLIPLDRDLLLRLSPNADAFLRQYDLTYLLPGSESHPLSIDPGRTRLGLLFLVCLTLLLVGTAVALTRTTARQLAFTLVLVGAALALTGIVQAATFNGKIYGFWQPLSPYAKEPFGPFVNRNHFAGWMLMGLPLAMGVFSATVSRGARGIKPGWRQRVLWLSSPDASRGMMAAFAVLAMALSLVMTTSRSGVLGLAGAICLCALAMSRRQASATRVTIVWGYLVFVGIVTLLWTGVDRIMMRFASSDVTMGGRTAIWADTVRIARDFWLTGTGFNTYGVSTLYYQTALPDKHVNEAHNDYLQLAAEGGILLSVPIVLTIAAFAWQVRRRLKEDVGSTWWIRAGAVTGLVAIAVQSLVDFSLQMPGNAVFFAVLAGLAIHDGRLQFMTGREQER